MGNIQQIICPGRWSNTRETLISWYWGNGSFFSEVAANTRTRFIQRRKFLNSCQMEQMHWRVWGLCWKIMVFSQINQPHLRL